MAEELKKGFELIKGLGVDAYEKREAMRIWEKEAEEGKVDSSEYWFMVNLGLW